MVACPLCRFSCPQCRFFGVLRADEKLTEHTPAAWTLTPSSPGAGWGVLRVISSWFSGPPYSLNTYTFDIVCFLSS